MPKTAKRRVLNPHITVYFFFHLLDMCGHLYDSLPLHFSFVYIRSAPKYRLSTQRKMHVRKLHPMRVIQDMAVEAFQDEHLPEPWHHENPKTYSKKLRHAKKHPPVDITEMLPEGVMWQWAHIVSPILHSEPWRAEYYLPFLHKAKYWIEHGLVLWGRQQDPEVVKPIIDAFAEAGCQLEYTCRVSTGVHLLGVN